MERKFILNYNVLDNYLTEWQKNPHRTDGQLTLLRDNCKNNLKNILLNSEECEIIINESTREIKINGQTDLEDRFYTLPTEYEMSSKDRLYRQVKMAMDEAKTRWIYERIFTETESDGNDITFNKD